MVDTLSSRAILQPDPYYSESHATFGDRLCASREAAGISQKVLAGRIGVKAKTVRAWESDSVEPGSNKLQMVSALLNVSMVWLMSGLGTGIAPPESIKSSRQEIDEILNELKEIRSAGEALVKRADFLTRKIEKFL